MAPEDVTVPSQDERWEAMVWATMEGFDVSREEAERHVNAGSFGGSVNGWSGGWG